MAFVWHLVYLKKINFSDIMTKQGKYSGNGINVDFTETIKDEDFRILLRSLQVDMIKCALDQVLRLPNYISLDYFIFTTIAILLS